MTVLRRVAPWGAIAVLIALADYASKAAVSASLRLGEVRGVTGFFNLVLAHNRGAAFSFLSDAGGWQRLLFIGIAVFATAFIVAMLARHSEERVFSAGLALILGGALGNLWDRIVLGYVVDFLDFHAYGWHFWAFNPKIGAMEVLLANPRGFCAGVERAISIVEQALAVHGAPIYVRHEVVHNKYVVDDLRAKGAVFVEELAEVPSGSTVIFSAHGVSKAVRAEADARGLRVFDATCPLVTKVHVEVAKMRAAGREIVMIGHRGHPEVEGTMGQAGEGMHLVETVADVPRLDVRDAEKLSYVTQTTLSVDDAAAIVAALKARFPAITGPKKDDICYATQNRQDAVKIMSPQCDVVIVVGSPNSSNSNRLREVAQGRGIPAYMVDSAEQLKAEWVAGKRRVGITAGASAPEVLVTQLIARLKELGAGSVRQLDGVSENIVFTLPRGLSPRAAPPNR
jgi:4-hydroxy-3-methylbut-2-enyl diphosphate reductase